MACHVLNPPPPSYLGNDKQENFFKDVFFGRGPNSCLRKGSTGWRENVGLGRFRQISVQISASLKKVSQTSAELTTISFISHKFDSRVLRPAEIEVAREESSSFRAGQTNRHAWETTT